MELALVRRAAERGTPVLGICRGHQIINVALGGTLWQHLPETHGTGDHRRVLGSFEGNGHAVDLTPGSLAAAAAGETRHMVISHHHQGIRDLAPGLVASGYSGDGVVEALEGRTGYLLGVQWHPEADPGSRIIRSLVEAAAGR